MAEKESRDMLFRKAYRVMTLAYKLRERVEKVDPRFEDLDRFCANGEAHKHIAELFLDSAIDDFDAVVLLMKNDLLNAIFLAFRRIFELSIDLKFIGKCPKTRAKEFLLFEKIQRKRRLQFLEDGAPWKPEISDENRAAILAGYEEAVRAFRALGRSDKDSLRVWSRYTLEGKCKNIDSGSGKAIWERYYNTIYRNCCTYTHPTMEGLVGVLSDDSVIQLHVFAYAITGVLTIIMDVNRVLAGDMGREINHVWSMVTQGWVRL